MSITRGLDLVRDGKYIDGPGWKNWVFDAWVGEYLLEIQSLPLTHFKDYTCLIPRNVLFDMIDILEKKQFDVCPRAYHYFSDSDREQAYAERYCKALQALMEKYQEGDLFYYYCID